ncbi:MAG: PIN domain-containing protein [Chitinispirillia bacterium]|nr:PIN domain-containing protein [Chitinispirillia bacterium]MCL2269221.1 PIN domain-containing protein [Chitinispirillia bacterium]
MTKKVFIDSDAILDLLAQRKPFYDNAAKMFTLAYNKKIEIYTTAVVLANVFYILRKIKGGEESKNQLKNLRLLIRVLPVNEDIIDMTLNSKFIDFEDGLQYFTAKDGNIRTIITRNVKDYKVKDAVIQTPEEYLKTNRI